MAPSSKWWELRRRGGGDGGGDGDDSEPLDIQEQEEMVRSFERKHAQQSRMWKAVFAGFLLGYTAFLIYSIIQQFFSPWELRYHAYFMDDIHSWMVILADWIAVLACLLAVRGLCHSSGSYQLWMQYSFYTGLLLAIFWLYFMLRLPRFHWDIIWLPLAPVSGAGICLYVDQLLKESFEDIRKLQGLVYNYKAL